MTAFVTGGSGFAGRQPAALLGDAVAPGRDELDLLDGAAVRSAVEAARGRSSTWPPWRRWGAPGRSPAAHSARTWR